MDAPVRQDDFPELPDDSAGPRPRDKPASQYREYQMVTVAIVTTPCFGVVATLRIMRRTLAAGEIASSHEPLFRRIKCCPRKDDFHQGRQKRRPLRGRRQSKTQVAFVRRDRIEAQNSADRKMIDIAGRLR